MATFYVSNSGAIGTLTLADINVLTFSAGDVILFNRGETFAGRLDFNGSGSAGNPILIGAYGSGAKPIITTKTTIPGADVASNWTLEVGNVWRMPLASPNNVSHRIWLDGIEYKRAQTKASIDNIKRTSYSVDIAFTLYVYSPVNPALNYAAIEYSSDNHETFFLSGQNYITVENLDFRGSTGASVYIEGCSNLIFQDCAIGLDSSRMGLQFAVGLTSSNNIIRRCVIDSGDRIIDDHIYQHGLADGVYCGGGVHGLELYENTLQDWGHSLFELSNLFSGTDTAISDILVHDNFLTSLHVDYCRAFGMDNGIGRTATNIRIYNNTVDRTTVRSQLDCDGLYFGYNKITNVTNSASYLLYSSNVGASQALLLSGYSNTSPTNMVIENNLFANCEDVALMIQGDSTYNPVSGLIVRKNIFYNCGTNSPSGYYSNLMVGIYPGTGTTGALNFDTNLFYNPSSTLFKDTRLNASPITFASWQASTGTNSTTISNNINSDPLLTDPGNDNFTPANNSPVYTAGIGPYSLDSAPVTIKLKTKVVFL